MVNRYAPLSFFLLAHLFAIPSYAQSTGDIAFVGFNADGDDDFAIVVLADLTNATIYFSDDEANGAGGFVDSNEGALQWLTGATTIPAGTVVTFTDTDNAANMSFGASIGTLSAVSGAPNLSGSGDGFFAYLGTDSGTPTTFLAAIKNSQSDVWGDLTGTGLTEGTTALTLGSSGTPDGGSYSGSRIATTYAAFLPLVNNTNNWTATGSTGDGETLLPFSTDSFLLNGVTITGTAGFGNDEGWRMFGVLSSGIDRNDITGITFSSTSGSGNDILRTYSEDSGGWLNTSAGAALTHGTGFIAYLFDDATDPINPNLTVSFTGATETTSDVVVSGLEASEDFILMGNPFLQAFDLSSLNLSAQAFQTTVQVWNPGSSSYTNVVQAGGDSDVIALGQGFFVERSSMSASTSLTFAAAGRTTGGTFIGAKRSDVMQVALALNGTDADGNTVYDEAAKLVFRPEASEAWDAFEASKLTPLTNQFVSIALMGERNGEARPRSVASYPDVLTSAVTIPLQLDGRAFSGEVTLSWPRIENLPSDWALELVDHETGKRTNLRLADGYTFDYTAPANKTTVLTQPVAIAAKATTTRFDLVITPAMATNTDATDLPQQFVLKNAYPNPFNPTTTLRYQLGVATQARLVVYDALGREVAVLTDGMQAAGTHTVQFEAGDLASGVYLYRLETPQFTASKTLLLLK